MNKIFSTDSTSVSTWIWYPGDFEIWLSNKMQVRRTEREAVFPPLWQYYSPFPLVTFQTEVDIPEPDELKIYSEGSFQLLLDGIQIYGQPKSIKIPAGKHKISFKVYHQEVLPAIYIEGKYVKSDASWKVTNEDKLWIDENGNAQVRKTIGKFADGHSSNLEFRFQFQEFRIISNLKLAAKRTSTGFQFQ